jgi:hypothetical protein
MRANAFGLVFIMMLGGPLGWGRVPALAGDLIVELGKPERVTLVGVIQRWDEDGKARFPVDPKAKIDNPRVDAQAQHQGNGRWVFRDLSEGRYDLVILTGDRVRVEGFHYPPINEFDPFLPSNSKELDEETLDWIKNDIAKSRHYENKVSPLFLAGDDKQVRLLVQLVRDQPTSFDSDFGASVATVRHEIWQYTNNYGGWVKDRKTEVLDRILMAKDELERWTWVWKRRLGGVEIGKKPVTIVFEFPARFDPKKTRGWFPG